MQQTRILQKIRFIDNAVMHALALSEGQSILVLGCYDGRLCRRIAGELDTKTGGGVWGIDKPPQIHSLKVAERESGNSIFQAMEIERMEFSDNYFDAIISSLFFDYLSPPEKQRDLQESYRLLKPGGKLVIAHLDIQQSFWGTFLKGCVRYLLHMKHFDRDSSVILKLIHDSGFTPPWIVAHYWGFISIFATNKPA